LTSSLIGKAAFLSLSKAIENIWTQIGNHFSNNEIGPADVDRVIRETRDERKNDAQRSGLK